MYVLEGPDKNERRFVPVLHRIGRTTKLPVLHVRCLLLFVLCLPVLGGTMAGSLEMQQGALFCCSGFSLKVSRSTIFFAHEHGGCRTDDWSTTSADDLVLPSTFVWLFERRPANVDSRPNRRAPPIVVVLGWGRCWSSIEQMGKLWGPSVEKTSPGMPLRTLNARATSGQRPFSPT